MLRQYLLNNFDELEQLVTSINAFNGELEHLIVLENDEEFFDGWFHNKPMEAVRASYYGDYNYNDPYVHFNGYGNLESFNEWEYEELLKTYIDEIIKVLYEVKDECNWIDEKIVKMANDELQVACDKYFKHFESL